MKKFSLLFAMLMIVISGAWADFTPQVSTSTTRYYYSFSSYSGRGYKIFTDPNSDAGTFGAGNDGTATAAQYFFEEGSATGQYYIRSAFSGKYWVSASSESDAAVTLTATKASATEWVVVNGSDYVTFKPSDCTSDLGLFHNYVSGSQLLLKLSAADPSNVTNSGSWWTPTLQQTITLPFEVSADVTSATKYYTMNIHSGNHYNIYADLDGGTAVKSKVTTETYSNQDYFKWAVGGSWDTGFYFYNKKAGKYLSYGTSASPSDQTNATLVDALETGSYLDLLHSGSTISFLRIHGSINNSYANWRSENLSTWASSASLGDPGSVVTIAEAEDIPWDSELFYNAKSAALSTVSTYSTYLPALFSSAAATTATTTINAITCTSESEYETKIAEINTAMATFYKNAEGKNVSIQQRGARNDKNYYLQANRTGSNYTSNETLTAGAVFNVVSNGDGTFNFQSALYGNYLPNLGNASTSIASSATAGAYNIITTSTVGEMKFDALVCGWSGYSGIHLDGSCNIVVWENSADANVWTVAAVSDDDWSTLVTSALSGVKYTIGTGVGTFTDDESGSMATAQASATSATTSAEKVAAFRAILAAESKVTLNDATEGECFRMKSSVTGYYLSSTTSAPASMVEASAATDNATVWCWTSKGLMNASTGLYYDGSGKTASSTAYTATVAKNSNWFGTYAIATNGYYIYNASGTTIDRGSSLGSAAGYAWVLEKVNMNVYEVAVAGISTTDAVLTCNGTDYAPGANIYSQTTLTTSDVTAKAQAGYGSVVRLSGSTFTVQYYTDLSSKTRVSSLDDLSNTTAYIINNKNNEGAMVIIPTVSTTLANLNNISTTSYTIGKTEFMNALDETDANQLWQILKDGDGKYYIYNVGQQKYLTLSNDRYQLTAATTATTTVTLSDGKFQFSADGDDYNYAVSCTQNTNGAVAWWTADDHGASWEVIAVEGTYVDPLTLPNWAALTEAYNQATPYADYIGTGLNKYTAEGYTEAYANVFKAINDKTTYYTTDKKDEVDGYTAAMNTAYGKLSLNMPATGWYRIVSANSADKPGNKGHYLTNVNSDGLTLTTTADNTTTMMYIDRENNKIKDYNGNYLNNYNEDPDATGKTWTIEAGTKIGTYALKLASGWYASDWYYDDKITYGNKDNNAIWTIEQAQVTAIMNITDAGWATFCAPFTVEIPEGVKAYTATMGDAENTWVKLTAVEGANIPAGTPVVLEGAEFDGEKTFTDVPATTETTVKKGCLTGNLGTEATAVEANKDHYLLQNNTPEGGTESVVGWYKVASDGLKIGVNRCYMTLGQEDNAREFIPMSIDETTAIRSIAAEAATKADGKYLVNGKIVVVKADKAYNMNGQTIK